MLEVVERVKSHEQEITPRGSELSGVDELFEQRSQGSVESELLELVIHESFEKIG